MPRPDFAANRRRLLDRLAPDEAVLLFGGPTFLRNGDSEHRYRPDSDVYWLTGWEDPDVAVFLRPGAEPLTMFVQPKDKEREIWTGFRPGPDGARADFGADAAFPWSELDKELMRLVQGVRVLHYAFARDAGHDQALLTAIKKAARAARNGGLPIPETFHAPSKLLHELRLHKDAAELEMLREAARITSEAHRAAMRAAAPGVTEYAIEALVDYTFRKEGGNGPGYTTIVAGGANACVLHYITNRLPLVDGELLLIDAGCEYGCYTADVTRTFPVNGRFTEPQRQVYELVLRAQQAAFAECRPRSPVPRDARRRRARAHRRHGRARPAPGRRRHADQGGEVQEVLHARHRPLARHGRARRRSVRPRRREPPADPRHGRDCRAGLVRARGRRERPGGVARHRRPHREDDLLVTDDGYENLTADIPKTVEEVEAACRA
jgi:Xaa-Pro aminopeptidase